MNPQNPTPEEPDPDAVTGCADDQQYGHLPSEAIRAVLRTSESEARDRETARRIASNYRSFSENILLGLDEEIELALSAARREGEAEEAVLREALVKAKFVMDHFGDYLNGMDVVDDVEKETGVSNEKVFAAFDSVRLALSSTTAGASLLKRLEDAENRVKEFERKLAIWNRRYPEQVESVNWLAAKEPQ